MSNEQAKLKALEEALRKSMAMYNTGESWGNMMLRLNKEQESNAARREAQRQANANAAAARAAAARASAARAAAAERAARNQAARERAEKKVAAEAKQAKIIANHKAKFMTPKGLRKIAKECRWHCEGKTCFAHSAGVCPYIHKGDPGSSKATGITLKNTNSKKKAGSGSGRTRKNRRS